MERVQCALSLCGVSGNESATTSILLGFEKASILQHITNELNRFLTPDSKLITGLNKNPIKIKPYVDDMMAAFRVQSVKTKLPEPILDIWKADLFVGNTDSDM